MTLAVAHSAARPAFAPSPPVRILLRAGILWRKLVAALAMRGCGSLCAAGWATKGKTLTKNAAEWRQNLWKGKTFGASLDNSIDLKAALARQITSDVRLSLNRYARCIPAVVLGFAARRPSAIFRIVPLVIVNSVNDGPGGAWPHVGHKISIGRPPSLAYRYAPSSVVFVLVVIGVGASLNDALPDRVEFWNFFERHGWSPLWRLNHAIRSLAMGG